MGTPGDRKEIGNEALYRSSLIFNDLDISRYRTMDNIDKQELRRIIHEEVVSVVSGLKDTLILQLIGFMRDEQAQLERGVEENRLVAGGSTPDRPQQGGDTGEPWFPVRAEPLTPLSELEDHGQLTSPEPIVEEVIGEYQAYECDGDSQRDKME